MPHLCKAQLKVPSSEIISEAPLFSGMAFMLRTAILYAFLTYWSLSLFTCAEFQSSLRLTLSLKVPERACHRGAAEWTKKQSSVIPHILSWKKKYPFFFSSGGSEVKAFACNVGDLGSIPGLGRSPGQGNGNPLQYSCLKNPMDGGAWGPQSTG